MAVEPKVAGEWAQKNKAHRERPDVEGKEAWEIVDSVTAAERKPRAASREWALVEAEQGTQGEIEEEEGTGV